MRDLWGAGFSRTAHPRPASGPVPGAGKCGADAGHGRQRCGLCAEWNHSYPKGPQARQQNALAERPRGPVSHGPHPHDHPGRGQQELQQPHLPRQAFALAHNGVLCNDVELRHTQRLPATFIETDSYVAVQLLEQAGRLCLDSLRQMAEALDGSFTITVLDTQNTLYLVRGNNPLTIRLFPELGCYLYASTDEILDMALDTLGLSGLCQADIRITQGDIMAIDAMGRRTTARFDDAKLRPQRYFFDWGQWERAVPPRELDDYMEMVLEYGQRRGVPEAELRLLMDAGYDAFDIEQLLYDHEGRESCVREIMADFGVC